MCARDHKNGLVLLKFNAVRLSSSCKGNVFSSCKKPLDRDCSLPQPHLGWDLFLPNIKNSFISKNYHY